MAVKVGMVSLGCPKNQVDAEMLLSNIKRDGFEITADAQQADVVVINTCGFIESAKQESIDSILEFCELKEQGQLKCVVVTGCLAERYREEIAKEIPEADVVLGIGSNADIAKAITQALDGKKVAEFGEKQDLALNGERVLSTPSYLAYLKIAEGCDNNCTYCAIPAIRGPYRSRKLEDIVKEAEWLASSGVKELIVVAQDTTRYGSDLYGELKLPELLRRLCRIDGFVWIRVLYCYPEMVTDELLDVLAEEPKMAKYIDIPIQHINSAVLRRMHRRSTREEILSVVQRVRERVPNVTIRTTLIAGFPGETKEQFEELVAFVKESKFDRLGCFAYSQEEGTPAAKLPDQLDEETKARRAELVMLEQQTINEARNRAQLGKTIKVLVEGFDRESCCYVGRSEADAPDIDSVVLFVSEKELSPGDFAEVELLDILEYDLMGRAV